MTSQHYHVVTATLLLTSVATCGVLAWRATRGRTWPPAIQPTLPPWPNWLLPLAIACYVLITIIGSRRLPKANAGVDAIRDVLTHNTQVLAVVFLVLAVLVATARRRTVVPPLPARDTTPSPTVPRQLLYGVVGFLTCLAPTLIVFLLTEPLRSDADLHPLLQFIRQDQSRQVLLAVAVSAVLVAPWVEEMAFRVILQRALLRHYSPGVSILATAAAFCAVHGSWLDAVGLFPLAIVLGTTYHRTGSFLAVVLTHMLFNAYNIVSMVMESLPATAG